MASRDLKDEEKSSGLTATVIATDGIAVIVNKENPTDGLTSDQVKSIYVGDTTDWADVKLRMYKAMEKEVRANNGKSLLLPYPKMFRKRSCLSERA